MTSITTNIADELAVLAAKLRHHTVKVKNGSLEVGSGVIWQADGLIITNAHVVTSNQATVELSDGRVFAAVRTRFDPQQDLAALKIAATDLNTASIGDSDRLRVGELVLAVGNPLADTGAVTTGIISANNPRVVMADIRLYPGNSGGPLADCLGRVVGINTMIANNLAVAIPSKTVVRFLSGYQRPQLGVSLQPVLLSRRSLGLLVLSVLSNSAAETAGLQVGDVLVGVSRRLFTKPDDLARYLHSNANKSIALQVLRGKRQFVVDVFLRSEKPAVEAR
ncbi:trypsin-like peptidase domain-containing protein [Nostoc sp. CENA67]|uniref:Trypsin-like peptidase domain-containing protein n=1 Tax=Amazonocrinis nigriterrae CENA67 TaxID=2794033 RepID=A0A8J7HXC0_9NOST|nr:trypsin-like peptidase domain-containing protein [Amazonocrinis nigriterrae]MBH8565383.1 trypsin-like peptidase domain-containing protein [Amazonocrinis nigriterrae CENA67]